MKRDAVLSAVVPGVLICAAVLLWFLWTDPVIAPGHVEYGNAPGVSVRTPPSKSDNRANTPKQEGAESEPLNDPRTGWVRMKVVDDRTGQPMPNTRCRMFDTYPFALDSAAKVEKSDELYHWNRPESEYDESGETGPTWLASDASGVLRVDITFSKEFGGMVEVSEATEFSGLAIYPLPQGYAPVTRPRELAAQLVLALKQTTEEPISVRVRGLARIRGRVVDESGAAVHGAQVRVALKPNEDWAEYCYPDKITSSAVSTTYGGRSWWEDLAEGLAHGESIQCEPALPAVVRTVKRYAYGETVEWIRQVVGGFEPPLMTNEQGTFEFDAAPGIWELMVSGSGYDPASARIKQGDSDSDVTLTCKRQCSLDLQIVLHVLPEIEASSDEPYSNLPRIRLAAVSPMLSPETEYWQEWELEWQAHVDPGGASSLNLQFTGIPPVWMVAQVSWGSATTARHFLARPGEARQLTLELGEGEVQLELPEGTPQPECLTLVVETPPTMNRSAWEFSRDKGYRIQAAPGSYIAHLPDDSLAGLVVRHGQTTYLRVAAQFMQVEFRLDEELESLLGPPIDLDLVPVADDEYRAVFGTSHEGAIPDFFHAAHPEDANWVFQDRTVTVQTCPDVYTYTVSGSRTSIEGTVDLRGAVSVVSLTPNSLPGLERLDLSLICPWTPHVYGTPPQAFKEGWGYRALGGLPDGGVAALDGSRWIVWSALNDIDVVISSKDEGAPEFRVSATVPGHLELDLTGPFGTFAFVEKATPGQSTLVVELSSHQCSFIASHVNWPTSDEATVKSACIVPVGRYTVRIEQWSAGLLWHGVWEGEISIDGISISKSDLELMPKWQPFEGVLTSTGPVNTFDGPMPAEMRDAVNRLRTARPLLYRRENGRWQLAGTLDKPFVEWGTAELRAIASLSNKTLAPGEYRMDAWPGAPAKYRKEFAVKDEPVIVEISLD